MSYSIVSVFNVAFLLVTITFSPALVSAQQEKNSPTDQTATAEAVAAAKAILLESERIVFLGDSNTHAAEYIVQLEAAILEAFGDCPEMINLGLSSETCCGLSEPIHPFPRPDVQERLDRALEKTKPDVVVACYGMNDGIYHPFKKNRFKAYQKGIKTIITKVNASGAKLILLTPPPFDALPARLNGLLVPKNSKEFSWLAIYENYDSEVMKPYATFVLEQKDQVLAVVDTHTSVTDYLAQKRESEPKFTFSKDGVHFDKAGHRVFAQGILDSLASSCGIEAKLSKNDKLLELVRKRQSISHSSWLSEVKHLRPGIKDGLPRDQAKEKIAPISAEIETLLK